MTTTTTERDAAEATLRSLLQPGKTVFWYEGLTREGEPWFRLFVGTGDTITRITVDVAVLLGLRRLRNARYAGRPFEVVPDLAAVLFGSPDALREEEL